ncbi:peroxisomal biogenesis factor 11-domain-containing protein [Parasitella parasitica]|nr:peroxisomal biogenesis factor 11-domain-containing protein [Parasitella parasitica]
MSNSTEKSLYNFALLAPPSPPPEPDTCDQKPVTQQRHLTKRLIATRSAVTRWAIIIQKLLKELDGRDKLMKIIQYFIKILLHYKLVKAKHWSTITSHFSMTRKLLRFGTAIGPIRELSPLKSTIPSTLITLNATVNGISDDIFCLYKLGVFGSYVGALFERISAYCWFAGILVDLREGALNMSALKAKSTENEKPNTQLIQKIHIAEVSIIKLLMDAVFCACDIRPPKQAASIQAWSGFFSGVLAGYKLWIKFSA